MKKIIYSSIASLCYIAVLSGCGPSLTYSGGHIKKISEEKLTAGKVTKVGYTAPQPEWRCDLLESQSYNWSNEQFKAQFSFMQNGYTMLQKKALEYAREKNLDVNYIYLDIPKQWGMGSGPTSISFTPTAKAYINYLKCQYPPAVSNKVF